MENLKYRVIYEYEFRRGTSAAETARRINDVYGGGVAKENTVRFWFQRFRSGNFDLQNKPRGRPESKVDNEELKAIVEADPSQTTSQLAAGCGVSEKTVLIHLKQIGKVSQKQFKCDLCNNKRYMSLDRLNNHKVVCTGERSLKFCHMCTKIFDNSRSLNSHKKVHSCELKCDKCREQLRSLEQFTNHKTICLGTGPEGVGNQNNPTGDASYSVNRCCQEPGLYEHDKPAYLNIPGYAAGRLLDATLSSLKSELN